MRPTNSATSYQPGEVPTDVSQIPRFLREEQAKLKAALDALSDGFDPVMYAPPTKPRKGMRRYADGTQWNPGSGEGLYRFDGVSWKYLG